MDIYVLREYSQTESFSVGKTPQQKTVKRFFRHGSRGA